MNTTFEQISTSDAAKMLKLDKSTITKWCKQGLINFIDVSSPSSTTARYVFEEGEIDEIKRLIKKYGKGKWMTYYSKNWNVKVKQMEQPVNNIPGYLIWILLTRVLRK